MDNVRRSAEPDFELLAPAAANRPASPGVSAPLGSSAVNRRTSPGASMPHGESVLCDGTNYEQWMQYLIEEMSIIGIPRLLSKRLEQGDLCFLVNVAYLLLRRALQAAKAKEELENRLHSCQCELDLSRSHVARLKEKAKGSSVELAQLQELRRQHALQLESLQSKLKAEAEEVKRLTSSMMSRETQYVHELKKRERELAQLKERMARSLATVTMPANLQRNGEKDRLPGICILNLITNNRSSSKSRNCLSSSTNIEEMYKVAMSNYEQQRRLIISENSDLRRCLADVHKEIVELLAACCVPGTGGKGYDPNALDQNITACCDGQFGLPYDMISESMQQSFRKQCQILRSRLNQGEMPATGSAEFLGKSSQWHPDKCSSEQGMSSWENKDPLAGKQPNERKALIDLEKRHLQEMLGNLNKQRQAFEEEKASWLRKQFMDQAP